MFPVNPCVSVGPVESMLSRLYGDLIVALDLHTKIYQVEGLSQGF